MMRVPGELTSYSRQETAASPCYLMIEPTNRCNLRCVTCSRETISSVGTMSLETFKRIVDGFPALETVKWHGQGESLLVSTAVEQLEYLQRQGVQTVLITNGQWKDAPIERVLELIDHFYVSIDSANSSHYEEQRRGASWKRLLDNLERIRKARRDTPVPCNFNSVISRETVHDLEDVVELAACYEFPAVRFQIVQNWISGDHAKDGDGEDNSILHISSLHAAELVESLGKARQRGEILGVEVELVGNPDFTFKRCIWPFERVYVTWDGEVIPCCMRPHPAYSFGNLLKEDFSRIWMGAQYRGLRERLKSGLPADMCRDCPYIVNAGFLREVRSLEGKGSVSK